MDVNINFSKTKRLKKIDFDNICLCNIRQKIFIPKVFPYKLL